ncbi:MAG: hypothetical protein U9R27_08670 [Campylobacterota bacterium]|nr:hypothetical protein [Campylobacterota bacterium]
MRSSILLLWATLLFTGCNQGESQSVKMVSDTYHKVPTGYTATPTAEPKKTREEREDIHRKEIEIAKLKREENLQLAKIEADTQEHVKRIEVEAMKHKILVDKEVSLEAQKIEKEIAASRETTLIQTKERDLLIDQIIIAVVAGILLITLLVYYLMQHKKRVFEMKIQEEKLKHEAHMQATTQHHEKISRVLEIIADKDTDSYVKNELLGILKEPQDEQVLIEYSPTEDEVQKEEESQEKEVKNPL